MTDPTRRRFGQAMGAALVLVTLPIGVRARDDTRGVEVRIARFAFTAARIEIEAGDSVTWVNEDAAPHTATAETGAWGTATLNRGEARRIAFEVPGTYRYFCRFHPHMTGLVTVRARTVG